MNPAEDAYIRFEWCENTDLWSDPNSLKVAVATLHSMGIHNFVTEERIHFEINNETPKTVICQALSKNTCKLISSEDCENKNGLAIKCGHVTQCEPIENIVALMDRDQKYSAKFSNMERKQIKHLFDLLRHGYSPCRIFSSRKKSCVTQGDKCAFHIVRLFRSLINPGTQDFLAKTCYVKPDFLTNSLRSGLTIDEYISLTYDVLMQQSDNILSIENVLMYQTQATVYEEYLKASDWMNYRFLIWKHLQKLNEKQLKEVIQLGINIETGANLTIINKALLDTGQYINLILHSPTTPWFDPIIVNNSAAFFAMRFSMEDSHLVAFILNTCVTVKSTGLLPWTFYLLFSYLGQDNLTHFITNPWMIAYIAVLLWYVNIDATLFFGPLAYFIDSTIESHTKTYVTHTNKNIQNQGGLFEMKPIRTIGVSHSKLWQRIAHAFQSMVSVLTQNPRQLMIINDKPWRSMDTPHVWTTKTRKPATFGMALFNWSGYFSTLGTPKNVTNIMESIAQELSQTF